MWLHVEHHINRVGISTNIESSAFKFVDNSLFRKTLSFLAYLLHDKLIPKLSRGQSQHSKYMYYQSRGSNIAWHKQYWVLGRAKRLISLFLQLLFDDIPDHSQEPHLWLKRPLRMFREYWCFKSWCWQASYSTWKAEVTPQIVISRKTN
jgi:hypothetical protein